MIDGRMNLGCDECRSSRVERAGLDRSALSYLTLLLVDMDVPGV